jgi:glycosyltransferase involved in cell wall biosynthesis
MRIAVFSWESLHSIAVGGVAVHVTELAAALERCGHEVHVFTRRANQQSHYDRIHGVHYHRCTFERAPAFVDEMKNMCHSFANNLLALENSVGHFDIVHMHDWLTSNTTVSPPQLKEGKNRKTVLTMHSTEYGRNGNQFLEGQAAHIQEQERMATHSVDKIIAVSNHLKEEICWLYQLSDSKVEVIHNGVNVNQFDYELDVSAVKRQYQIGVFDPIVLFVGRMVFQKGPDILVSAIPLVLKNYPQAKFILVGDGDMKNHVEAMANNSGITHALRLLGDRRGRELSDLFKTCDILAVPSRNEPFGIVVLEGWSARKPVLTTKRGGLAEFVQHEVNGLIVDATPDSVAAGLDRLLAVPERSSWIGSNGRATVESAAFRWDNIAQQIENVYKKA